MSIISLLAMMDNALTLNKGNFWDIDIKQKQNWHWTKVHLRHWHWTMVNLDIKVILIIINVIWRYGHRSKLICKNFSRCLNFFYIQQPFSHFKVISSIQNKLNSSSQFFFEHQTTSFFNFKDCNFHSIQKYLRSSP